MRDRNFNKVFGIGLSRTGSTSLNQALIRIGLNSIHFPWNLDIIQEVDAATDTSITRVYKELDRKYPKSKFILTTRDEDRWIESCHRFFLSKKLSKRSTEIQMDIYGCGMFDQVMYRLAYRAHLKDVEEYFKDRPGDLLVLDICAGDGWEKICPFLCLPLSHHLFPHANASMEIDDLRGSLSFLE